MENCGAVKAFEVCKYKNSVVSYNGVYIVPEEKYIELIVNKMENEINKEKLLLGGKKYEY